ncbi:MAG: hypothetical protein AAGC55_30415, partial [Myxococcota bacterium]
MKQILRRTFILLILLGVFLGIKVLQTETDAGGPQSPLTLAAIGFVMLAAFTVAELGGVLTLPRVTGYILCGVVLGPSAANILSGQVVEEMT